MKGAKSHRSQKPPSHHPNGPAGKLKSIVDRMRYIAKEQGSASSELLHKWARDIEDVSEQMERGQEQ